MEEKETLLPSTTKVRKTLLTGCLLLLLGPLYPQEVYDYIPEVTHEEIEDRLQCLSGEFPLTFNNRVKGFIDYFTIKNRDFVRAMMARAPYYFPIFEPYLKKYAIPDKIKYLAVIESGLSAQAVSSAQAVGLWQFVSSTGKQYGLKNSWIIDDRMDPHKATDAACRHLKDLYDNFGDWELAIAAYNCGSGNVNKAIRKSGGRKDFWKIFPHLPRETRGYVPQFIAIVYTLSYPHLHNLHPSVSFGMPRYDTLMIKAPMHMDTFSRMAGLCSEDLRGLNPSMLRGMLPDDSHFTVLRVPQDRVKYIRANRATLLDSASQAGRAHLKILARSAPGSTYGKTKLVYRVKKGDYLGKIARRYQAKVSDLRIWNNLRSDMIRAGQRLNVWIPQNQQPLPSKGKGRTPNPVPSQNQYLVKSGDTLWDISRASQVSVPRLKALNNLKNNTIQPGQLLLLHPD